MKKVLFIAFIVAFASIAKAQNLQVHYDFGKERKMVTTTLEMFKPDKYGSTFFFADMDYGSEGSGVDGINLSYWEIARSFKWNETQKLEPRVEYNGGFFRFADDSYFADASFAINDAWLIGAQYTWNNQDFSKVFTLQANYKTIRDKDAGFQITGVWGLHFFDRKLSFMGFADFWKEENIFMNETTDFVFLTEPQLWYNINKTFSVGGEVEISSNFGGNKGSMVNPTLGAKWTF
ncbi:DUF5020 family protein [Labilibacter marinus]|uniref:DUF5020 family protein n=1 Tax=Labilibacter marinus TaxID=1477105 RepID=UPI00082EE946|nr:DUF5020 family protein [Labilibacter marinus]